MNRPPLARDSPLVHGWRVTRAAGVPATLVREFIRPAVRAVPSSMARRIGCCRIWLGPLPNQDLTSQWIETPHGIEVRVTTAGLEEHDVALELLLCLGQALWGSLSTRELRDYWSLIDREILEGVRGEIDEQAFEQRQLLVGRSSTGSRRLDQYGRASFAGTAAEYVHCLWHDVTVRTGPDHLPAAPLRRRLELLARWFPPDRGYRLFPPAAR